MTPSERNRLDDHCCRIALGYPTDYPSVHRAFDVLSDATKRLKLELVSMVENCARFASCGNLSIVDIAEATASILRNENRKPPTTDGIWDDEDD